VILLTVGIGGIEVTDDRERVLITHGLGSCVAVMLWDPIARVGGMLHFQLPIGSLAPERAKESPGTFADTGIPLLFERMYMLGAKKKDIIVKVAGGGHRHVRHRAPQLHDDAEDLLEEPGAHLRRGYRRQQIENREVVRRHRTGDYPVRVGSDVALAALARRKAWHFSCWSWTTPR
jgi:hypothetical protein